MEKYHKCNNLLFLNIRVDNGNKCKCLYLEKKGIKTFYLSNLNDNLTELGFKPEVNYPLYSHFKATKLNDLSLLSLTVKPTTSLPTMESS